MDAIRVESSVRSQSPACHNRITTLSLLLQERFSSSRNTTSPFPERSRDQKIREVIVALVCRQISKPMREGLPDADIEALCVEHAALADATTADRQ